MNALQLDTVRMSADRTHLEILDQTLLPGTVKVLQVSKIEDIWEAIKLLRVRGAPAIGVCAGYAIALTASGIDTADPQKFCEKFMEQKEYLASSRPTAVNLFWALNRMERVMRANLDKDVAQIKEILFTEAQAIRDFYDAAGDCTGRPYQYAKAVGEGNVALHSAVEYIKKAVV